MMLDKTITLHGDQHCDSDTPCPPDHHTRIDDGKGGWFDRCGNYVKYIHTQIPVLPDFTRWSWASLAERAWWAPLFSEASNAFMELERLSVIHGLRKAAWQFVPFADVPQQAEWAARNGLLMVPTGTGYLSGYSASGVPGAVNSLRVVYTQPQYYTDVLPFNGTEKIGDMLGFPKCCQQAFDRTWGSGQVDSTFEQLTASARLYVAPEASTLMRWMGLRFVAHMPCTYGCTESIAIGQAWENLGKTNGFIEEMHLIREVLNWPLKWNRLFGIAMLETPALRISTRSDWTPTKQEFSINVGGTYFKPTVDLWKDNGFPEPGLMRNSHNTLLASLRAELPQGARVLDLGCGNGLLLRRLKVHRPDVKIAGIDYNDGAIKRIPMLSGWWRYGTIDSDIWSGWNPTAVLINPVRLLEMDNLKADATREALRRIPQIFLYAYPDKLKDDDLQALATKAKLPEIRMLQKTPDVSVGLLNTV